MKIKLLKLLLKIRKTGTVIYGHNVSLNDNHLLPTLHIQPLELERTINSFLRTGVEFITIKKLIEISKNGFKHNKPWVHFTFDDGYKENLSVILPIFEKYKLPFTVFISTNHIDKQERFYSFRIKLAVLYAEKDFELLGIKILNSEKIEERNKKFSQIWPQIRNLNKKELLSVVEIVDNLLSLKQKHHLYDKYYSDNILTLSELRELSKNPLVHIGSHCHNHLILNKNINKEEIELEMKSSKEWLEKNLNIKVTTFCYPNGSVNDYTKASIDVSKKYFSLAFTTVHGFVTNKTNPYLIPRAFLLPETSSLIHRMALPDWIIKLKLMLRGQIRVSLKNVFSSKVNFPTHSSSTFAPEK